MCANNRNASLHLQLLRVAGSFERRFYPTIVRGTLSLIMYNYCFWGNPLTKCEMKVSEIELISKCPISILKLFSQWLESDFFVTSKLTICVLIKARYNLFSRICTYFHACNIKKRRPGSPHKQQHSCHCQGLEGLWRPQFHRIHRRGTGGWSRLLG